MNVLVVLLWTLVPLKQGLKIAELSRTELLIGLFYNIQIRFFLRETVH